MRSFSLISSIFCFALFLPHSVHAGLRLFTGNLEVISTSGNACTGFKGNHQLSLVIGGSDAHDTISGYFGGGAVMVGQLRGTSLGALSLRYPYADAERAEGHTMQVEISGATLRGELHDRHLDSSVDNCFIDLAHFQLIEADSNEAALKAYQQLSLQYEALLARSTAIAFSHAGAHAEAVQSFEKALALADKLYQPDSAQLFPFLTDLAKSYKITGRQKDFDRLYYSRIATLHDEAVRRISSNHQIRSLLQVGRGALDREDYQAALVNFRQALQINFKNREAIAATMSALIQSDQLEEAIAFLEQTEQKLDSEPDRQDVREAIANLAYQKARKEHKAGQAAEAEKSLRKAISVDPGTAHYLEVLARWVHKAGNYSEADAILKQGLDSFKDEARRQELSEARDKLRQIEMILAKIRRAGT